jgi:hypothetical protein
VPGMEEARLDLEWAGEFADDRRVSGQKRCIRVGEAW